MDSRSCVAAVVVAEAGERMIDVGWWMLWESDGESWGGKSGEATGALRMVEAGRLAVEGGWKPNGGWWKANYGSLEAVGG